MKLSGAKLRHLTIPGRHFDGGGLYLEVKPNGGRHWRLKYRFGGKEKLSALGVYSEVSLKDARQRRDDARRILAAGDDPGELRKAAKAKARHEAATSFEAVARGWLGHQSTRRTPGTLDAIRTSLETHVFPTIGTRPSAQVRPGEVRDIIKAIEARGAAETAGRDLQHLRSHELPCIGGRRDRHCGTAEELRNLPRQGPGCHDRQCDEYSSVVAI